MRHSGKSEQRAGTLSMPFRGDVIFSLPRRSRQSRHGRAYGALIFAVAAAALAGCGGGGVGSLLVDPARYSAYHCKDLVGEWESLAKREKELRNLMARASDGAGGTVVATFAYRSDYETLLVQQKVLQKTAAEQHCELVSSYKSDQTIR
jgi:hypothetical protein